MLKRSLPIVLLAALAASFFLFGLDEYVSFAALSQHRGSLLAWVDAYPMLSAASYTAAYALMVSLSLPVGLLMTLTGGLLFGAVWGGLYAVTGATVGATAIVLSARTSLGDFLLAKAGNSMQKMQQGFAENALSYMFMLRLLPIFPFFIVNLAPAFLNVPLRTYMIASFFGMIPATFVYTLAGSGLGKVFDQGDTFSAAGILTPEMIGGLIGLALLSAAPILYKKLKKTEVNP
ncbi:MAG: VTT domain-containing protein [Ghiorsea sp.]